MKSEKEVKKQLEEVYEHRFMLRVERKTKRCCRNCTHSVENSFDVGEFGKFTKLICGLNQKPSEQCDFSCCNFIDDIEKEMLQDISNPSVCGSKEPKIAALLWVLHDGKKSLAKEYVDDIENKNGSTTVEKKSILKKIMGVFGG